MNGGGTFATTFLASAVEAIEMVAIVIGVGLIRGWRASLIGAGAGLLVLVVLGVGLGTALTSIPIDTLRLVIGALLLAFGLGWLRKGVTRVAAKGFAGDEEVVEDTDSHEQRLGMDWTGFVLSFKGVLLEGLEIAFIVVTFGATANQLTIAAIGGASAVVLVAVLGATFHRSLREIPRSVLILSVGLMLTTFGTFWAAEGLGVHWPGDEIALPVILAFYCLVAAALIALQRRRLLGGARRPTREPALGLDEGLRPLLVPLPCRRRLDDRRRGRRRAARHLGPRGGRSLRLVAAPFARSRSSSSAS